MTETLERKIAKITKTTLGLEDHGIWTCWLHLDYGSSVQGAGGYALSQHDEVTKRQAGWSSGMEFLIRLMEACGVDAWEDLPGRTVYALVEPGWGGLVRGLEPLPTEPGSRFLFDEVMKRQAAEAGAE